MNRVPGGQGVRRMEGENQAGKKTRRGAPSLRVQAAEPCPSEVTGPYEVGQTRAAAALSSLRGGRGDLSRSPEQRMPYTVPAAVAVAAAAARVPQSPSAGGSVGGASGRSGDLGAGPRCAGSREGGGARALCCARDRGAGLRIGYHEGGRGQGRGNLGTRGGGRWDPYGTGVGRGDLLRPWKE